MLIHNISKYNFNFIQYKDIFTFVKLHEKFWGILKIYEINVIIKSNVEITFTKQKKIFFFLIKTIFKIKFVKRGENKYVEKQGGSIILRDR